MTVYFLLSRNRSGTGALGSMLDQTTSMQYLWEAFHEGLARLPENYFFFMRRLCEENPDAWMPSQARTRFDRYVAYLGERATKRDMLISVKYNSMHHFNAQWLDLSEAPTLFKILRERNASIIHLRRKNHLRVYVSGLLAERNGVWHARDTKSFEVQCLKLDLRKCLVYLRGQEREDDRVNWELRGYQRLLELEYAKLFDLRGEITADTREALEGFCHVRLDGIKQPDLVKLTPRALDRAIENYDEIGAGLKGTPYEWMLAES